MGRRKIEIQPICEERNRTVTFIKRKAGLFKKAHELAVLCQVDVAVVILGSNNTFYEFSSVDMQEMIKYYQRDDLVHDVKGPSDFGDYAKKHQIQLNEHTGRKPVRNARHRVEEEEEDGEEEEEDEDEEERSRSGSRGRMTRNSLKREQKEEEEEEEEEVEDEEAPDSKRAKTDVPPKFNPLQQMVQRQFQNLYQAASSSPNGSTTEVNKVPSPPEKQQPAPKSPKPPRVRTPMASTPANRVDNVKRPVLRVQIPSSNTLYNPGIHSGSSSASSVGGANANLISRNTSAVRYDANPLSPRRQTPTATAEHEKNDPNRLSTKPLSGNSYGLPPMFSGSPAFPSYLATPLQGQANNPNHGPPYPGLKQPQLNQHHTPQPPSQVPHPQQTEPPNGPFTGSLPSKFAHDLMVPSPNTSMSMSMFQDWTLGPTTAKTGPNALATNPQNTATPAPNYNNGSSGLTPYMMVNQTPLANRFFSFTADSSDDKNQGTTGNNTPKGP